MQSQQFYPVVEQADFRIGRQTPAFPLFDVFFKISGLLADNAKVDFAEPYQIIGNFNLREYRRSQLVKSLYPQPVAFPFLGFFVSFGLFYQPQRQRIGSFLQIFGINFVFHVITVNVQTLDFRILFQQIVFDFAKTIRTPHFFGYVKFRTVVKRRALKSPHSQFLVQIVQLIKSPSFQFQFLRFGLDQMRILRYGKSLGFVHFLKLKQGDFQTLFIAQFRRGQPSGAFFFLIDVVKLFLLFVRKPCNFLQLPGGKQRAFVGFYRSQCQILRSLDENIAVNVRPAAAQIDHRVNYRIVQRTQAVIQRIVPAAFNVHHVLNNVLRRHVLILGKQFFVHLLRGNVNVVLHAARHRRINVQLASDRFRILRKNQLVNLDFIADTAFFGGRTTADNTQNNQNKRKLPELIHRSTPQNI